MTYNDNIKQNDMASINQLVSEMAHALGEPNNYALRRNLQLVIVHERNEKIRQHYEKHGFIDEFFKQRFRVQIINVPDGDTINSDSVVTKYVKRTLNKVPRPVRLTNGLPFMSIRTVGSVSPITVPFIREDRVRFTDRIPGMCRQAGYDYINEYVYLWTDGTKNIDEVEHIVIESIFEQPQIIPIETVSEIELLDTYDDEYLLPDDMVEMIKETIFKRNIAMMSRENNEVNVQPKTQPNGGGQGQQQ